MKKKKKGSWTFFTVLIFPVFLTTFYFLSVFSGIKMKIETEVINTVDSALLFLTSDGNSYSVAEEDGSIKTYCSLDKDKIKDKYDTYIKKSIIESINGYNDSWSVIVEHGGVEEEFTFAELKESNRNNGDFILIFDRDEDNLSDNITMKIKGNVPYARVSNYDEYYEKHTNYENEPKIYFEVKVTSSCH